MVQGIFANGKKAMDATNRHKSSNSAHGTSNAETLEIFRSPFPQGALGYWREPEVVGEIQTLLESL